MGLGLTAIAGAPCSAGAEPRKGDVLFPEVSTKGTSDPRNPHAPSLVVLALAVRRYELLRLARVLASDDGVAADRSVRGCLVPPLGPGLADDGRARAGRTEALTPGAPAMSEPTRPTCATCAYYDPDAPTLEYPNR